MNKMPHGWTQTTLESVCDIVRGITFPASAKESEPADDNVCCLRTANVQREIDWDDVYFVSRNFVKRDEQFVRLGDILMSMANSYELVGKVAVVRSLPFETAYGAFLSAVRPTGAVLGQYLFHFLRSDDVQRTIREGSSQTTNIANISISTLSKIAVPIAPLAEQQRIADKLDSLLSRVDSCRERLDRVPAILRRFRQSVLAAATTGKLTEDWRLETSNSCEYRSLQFDDDSFDIPKNWDVHPLGDLIDPLRPLCYGVVQPGHEATGGIPLIRVQDLESGTIKVEDLRTVTESIDKQYSRSRVQSGDLLISVVGTIGRTAIVPTGFEGNIARAIARVSCRSGLDSRWVSYWLNCNTLQWWLTKSSKEVARKTLNLGDLATASIAVPPEDEQREIVRRVGELFSISDNLNKRTTNGQALLEMLGPSILSKAFRGELVLHDPDDEPASVLLERIREQRQISSANKQKRTASRTPRAPRKNAAMNKSRFDDDVQGKPYLADFLKGSKKSLSAEDLFKKADLPLVDFYKQLDFEVKQKFIVDRDGQLEAA